MNLQQLELHLENLWHDYDALCEYLGSYPESESEIVPQLDDFTRQIDETRRKIFELKRG